MDTQTPWPIDHIGIAVHNIEASIAFYSSMANTSVTLRERLEERGVELAFLNNGQTKIELLAPLNQESKIATFLKKRGPGIHHICYRVCSIKAELQRLSSAGYTLIDSEPRPGAHGTIIAFISPESCEGVLTELCEYVTGQPHQADVATKSI
jgi:methylmalonyl-CoA epimerase